MREMSYQERMEKGLDAGTIEMPPIPQDVIAQAQPQPEPEVEEEVEVSVEEPVVQQESQQQKNFRLLREQNERLERSFKEKEKENREMQLFI